VLRRLHARRNYVPVAATLHELLAATRAHVGFALRAGGEQALANVLHVGELARQYELAGGISFRGFVDELRIAAETAQAAEAPILEEDSDGVRIMTVHKAKGLEFPIVILADLTCKLSRPEAGRWIDPAGNLCAVKLAGWAPFDLLLHDAEEAARDRAEGQRLAYVAATRARDVLVVPAVGDEVYDGGWLDPLMRAIYPAVAERRTGTPAAGCPAFPSRDTVLCRPDGDPARSTTVAPGGYLFQRLDGGSSDASPLRARAELASHSAPGTDEPARREPRSAEYEVVWWDPHVLALEAGSPFGLRREDLIAKDGDPTAVARRLEAYEQWRAGRAATLARGAEPSIRTVTATQLARDRNSPVWADSWTEEVSIVDLARVDSRPYGPRFGTFVHATLATVALDADEQSVRRIAETHARILLGFGEGVDEEIHAAVEVVCTALRHPIFDAVRRADAAGRCHRELPIIWQGPDGVLVEGTIDLAYDDGQALTALDFKTDRELDADTDGYRRQLAIYCRALGALDGRPTRGILMRV
jgi:ATP-dependent exoDNAse (exonuclease V) beta subunit